MPIDSSMLVPWYCGIVTTAVYLALQLNLPADDISF